MVKTAAQQDQVLLPRIKKHWLASSGCYGYRNIHLDLQDEKVERGRNRVLRLMHQANLRAIRGPSRPKGRYRGRPDVAAPNVLYRHHIEIFYNPTRRHTANQRLSPADYA